MRNFFTYAALFVVAVVVVQLFVFDSMRVSIWFSPLAYIAFVVLLPPSARPLGVLLLGLGTGATVDFFEGTIGLHTAATLFTAYVRRWAMSVTLGHEALEEGIAMPSPKVSGSGRFFRYAALIVAIHCVAFFSLEALTLDNYHLVILKAAVSSAATLVAVWACSLLFTSQSAKRL
ncbi:MAG: rod shape-determining protein MreD [Alistipes sp.]|jgi:hypothetical protein|nr:rod shape-determining protein MreD [Alistipes sp.]